VCRQVASAAELADHFAIRRRIFIDEQAIFAESDLDLHDRDTSAVALMGYCDGVAGHGPVVRARPSRRHLAG
jgi:hypothetical protein